EGDLGEEPPQRHADEEVDLRQHGCPLRSQSSRGHCRRPLVRREVEQARRLPANSIEQMTCPNADLYRRRCRSVNRAHRPSALNTASQKGKRALRQQQATWFWRLAATFGSANGIRLLRGTRRAAPR